MATTVRRKKISIVDQIKKLLLSSQVFPFVLTFAVIGILFVLFRMKTVELGYKISSINKDIEKTTLESKELKARKARLLSVKKLRMMAKKYDLAQPSQKQIIVIK